MISQSALYSKLWNWFCCSCMKRNNKPNDYLQRNLCLANPLPSVTLCCICLRSICFGLETRVIIKTTHFFFIFFFQNGWLKKTEIFKTAISQNFDDYPGSSPKQPLCKHMQHSVCIIIAITWFGEWEVYGIIVSWQSIYVVGHILYGSESAQSDSTD